MSYTITSLLTHLNKLRFQESRYRWSAFNLGVLGSKVGLIAVFPEVHVSHKFDTRNKCVYWHISMELVRFELHTQRERL